MDIDNSLLYTMPAKHWAVHAAVKAMQAAGAPSQVEFWDYKDPWGYDTHQVIFHGQTQVYVAIAGLLTDPEEELIAWNDMRKAGMIDPSVPIPHFGPPTPTPVQPGPQKLLDDVVGAADPNRPGMFEPAPGSNPKPGDKHSVNGQAMVAKQITTGMFGIIRWMPDIA